MSGIPGQRDDSPPPPPTPPVPMPGQGGPAD